MLCPPPALQSQWDLQLPSRSKTRTARSANGKAKMTKGERKMSKGKGNVIMGPRSLVHEKTPNGGKTKASGKTATGSLPRSKVKIQRSKVAKSKEGSTTSSVQW